MLQNTFVHADGIGASTERKLWECGAPTWDAFLDLHRTGEMRSPRWSRLAPMVEQSRAALVRREIEFFSQRLPASEQWRLFQCFSGQAAFFDIETTGLSADYDQITVIGLYDGDTFQAFVRGKNLNDFPAAAARYPLLVSYNGATFDLPFIRACFRGFEPRAHVDLRYPLRRLGYKGGLKDIEIQMGIKRPGHLRDIDGFEAINLWNRYLRGDKKELEKLVDYCRHDVVNLAPLAQRIAQELPRKLGCPSAG